MLMSSLGDIFDDIPLTALMKIPIIRDNYLPT